MGWRFYPSSSEVNDCCWVMAVLQHVDYAVDSKHAQDDRDQLWREYRELGRLLEDSREAFVHLINLVSEVWKIIRCSGKILYQTCDKTKKKKK